MQTITTIVNIRWWHMCALHIHALTHKFAHFIPQYFRRFFSSRCCCWFCHSFVLLSFEKHVFQFFFGPFHTCFFSLSFLCILFAQFSSLSAQVFCFIFCVKSQFHILPTASALLSFGGVSMGVRFNSLYLHFVCTELGFYFNQTDATHDFHHDIWLYFVYLFDNLSCNG